ncbi:MMPL family transporter [Exiguobacterium flavidum]|uniref:MMPL family transporter n=1 Tax=Exiguobacterium flavidum TaxID=2184695 RepID=UPI000DF8018C|nr:MMPL family transporter [Exiguobacterium flavidum]
MERFAKGVVRFRAVILGMWLIALVVLGYFALQLPDELRGNGFSRDGEYQAVEEVLKQDFGQDAFQIIVLFEGADADVKAAIDKNVTALGSVTEGKVIGPAQNPEALKDGKGYVLVGVPSEDKVHQEAVREAIIGQDGVSIRLTGEPIIVEDLNEASKNDLIRAELIGIPAALLVLLLVFGTPLAAIMPLVMGLITFVFGAGVLYFVTFGTDLSIFVLNAVAMISLALGIDFSLLYVNRFREEQANGRDVLAAAAVSIATAGRSILFSGLCVFVGLAGLLFIDVDVFQAVALGTLVSVLGAVLGALTLLPALLSYTGRALDRFRIFRFSEERGETRWRALARFVMKRPVALTVLSLALLLPCLLPLRDLELNIPQASALPDDYPSRLAFESFDETFGDDGTDALVLLSGDFGTREGLEELERTADAFKETEEVRDVTTALSATSLTPEQFEQALRLNGELESQVSSLLALNDGEEDKALLNVQLSGKPGDESAQDWVRQQRDAGFVVGGPAAFNQEIYDEIYAKMPLAVGVVVLATFLILMWAFRSILIPIKAILMNILSLGATFGLLVILFESGWVLPAETIGILTPVFIFSLVFGLSMDYEVFLVSRMEEYYDATGDNDIATEMGLAKTSKIITSAALIMIVVTGSFAFTGVSPIKQLGVGIALAIFIDATIVRMLLVPALMKLFGDWNWWWPGGRPKKKSYH